MSDNQPEKNDEFQEIKLLTRKEILSSNDSRKEVVDVSEWWGGGVYVKSLTASQKDAYYKSIQEIDSEGNSTPVLDNIRAKLCVLCICNEKGELIFTEPEDVIQLGKKNSAPVEKCFDAAQRLNKMRKEDIGAIEKNSEKGQN